MQLHCTDRATEEISAQLGPTDQLKLAYEMEGCGCVMSGVAQLWIINNPSEFDQSTSGNPFSILYDTRHAVFFEEVLKLDYQPDQRAFVLKSDNQIYNTHITMINKNKE